MRQIPEALDVRLATPAGVALTRAWARRRDRVEDIGQQCVGAETLREHGEPIAPDPRAIATGEADDHERVVAEAKLASHENRIGTLAQTSSVRRTDASSSRAP
jgi:hypothetical protein